MPCYNEGQYLHEAIDSVLKSSISSFEIIVINDGSTNQDTIDIINQINHPKIKVINIINGGLANARNVGINQASGKYLLPLDCDDKISNTYLDEGIAILEKHPEIKVVYCRAEYFDARQGEWKLPQFDFEVFMTQNLIFASGIFRKEDFDKTIGYNSNMIYGFEDWDFWMSMLKQGGKVYRIDKIHFYYRQKNRSMVKSINDDKIKYLRKQIFINHLDFYLANFKDPISLYFENEDNKEFKKSFEIIKNGIDYKIGKMILSPIRKLRTLFN